MVSEAELARFLDGSLGVASLDLARELVALRAQNLVLQEECNRLVNQCQSFAAVAEMSQGANSEARSRLNSICEALGNMNAELRDFLG